MDFSSPCALSASGGLLLLPDEIVRKMQSDIDLYIGSVKSDAHRHGVATVTTHRLIWTSRDGKQGHQWHLSQVCALISWILYMEFQAVVFSDTGHPA